MLAVTPVFVVKRLIFSARVFMLVALTLASILIKSVLSEPNLNVTVPLSPSFFNSTRLVAVAITPNLELCSLIIFAA